MRNRSALTLLYSANFISGIAQGISMLAIPWYFAQRGRSDVFFFWLGIFTIIAVVWSLFAGSIIDRFPRKKVFLGTNAVEGIVILCIGLFGISTGNMTEVMALAVFWLTLMGYNIHYPNLYAFGQEITPPDQYVRINSQLEVISQTTRALSGAGAAILLSGVDWQGAFLGLSLSIQIPAWDLAHIFVVDGATYFVAVGLIAAIRYTPYERRKVEQGKLLERLKGGFRFLNQHRLVALFGYCTHSIFAVAVVMIHGVLSPYVTDWLQTDGQAVGGIQLMYSIGAVTAGLFVKRWFATVPTPKTLVGFMVLASVACYCSAWAQSVTLYFGVGLVIGFTNAGSRILRISYLFSHVPNQVIGRVNSIFTVINTITRSIFIFLFATIWFQGPKIHHSYWVFGGFITLMALIMALNYRKLVNAPKESLSVSS
ncbi:MAG: MFS transporter [Bacteroidota bacterium]